MLLKDCTQYVSKFGKLSSGQRTGKASFHSNPKERQCQRMCKLPYSPVQSLSCVWLCDPMDCSTPRLPVHHQLPELTQTHVHRVGYAIQPSHLLSSLSPPAFNLSQHQGLYHEVVLHIKWPKYWSFSISPSNEHSGLISFKSKGFSRVFSNTTVQKHQFFSIQLFL